MQDIFLNDNFSLILPYTPYFFIESYLPCQTAFVIQLCQARCIKKNCEKILLVNVKVSGIKFNKYM